MISALYKRKLSDVDKKDLINTILDIICLKKDMMFAYIFGSFISKDEINDIDIGVYINDVEEGTILKYELELECELEAIIRIPVDVRIINNAPISFVYNILRNKVLILDNDKDLRSDFEGLIYKKYFDIQYLRNEYLREIVNAAI